MKGKLFVWLDYGTQADALLLDWVGTIGISLSNKWRWAPEREGTR